jgi:hypothetical protein
VKVLPDSKAVPAAWKYAGEILNKAASVATFAGLRSDVLSVKTFESPPPSPNGTVSANPTACTPGMVSRV